MDPQVPDPGAGAPPQPPVGGDQGAAPTPDNGGAWQPQPPTGPGAAGGDAGQPTDGTPPAQPWTPPDGGTTPPAGGDNVVGDQGAGQGQA